MKKIKLYMGIPTTGTIADSQVHTLRDLQERYGDSIEFVYPKLLVQRIFHDAARNGIVEDFLATDCDVLWFLDSDVTPPKHVLDLLTMHYDKWEAAGAPYPVFMAQPGEEERQIVFTAYRGTNGKGLAPSRIPYEGTDFVDGLATGCLFLKRSLFEKLERPYFEFQFDPVTRNPILGEDLGFCLKLNKLGIKFFTDYSMVCRHTKTVDLLEMNNYTISYANKAVTSYDNMIRGQVTELAKRVQKTAPKSRLILP